MSINAPPAHPVTLAAVRSTREDHAGPRIPATWLLIVYLALLLLVPSELVAPQIGSAGSPANILGIGFLLWWVCAKLAGQIRGPVNPLHVALGIFAVCVLLSLANGLVSGWVRPADVHQKTDAVWTLLPFTHEELFAKSVLGGTRGLISIGSWIGVALLLTDGLRSWRQVDIIIDATVRLTAIVAAMGVYQYFTGDNLARHIQLPGLSPTYEVGAAMSRSVLNRVSATTTHPLEFCVVLTTIFPLALHRALHPGTGSWARRACTAYLPAALIALAIPMAVSRSGIVALAAAMLVLFLGWPNSRRLWVLVLAPPVAILMRSALPGLLGTIRALFSQSTTDPSVTARTDDYAIVFRIYDEHPFLGRGAFTFIPQYYRTLDNQLLMILVELGAVGLVATLGLVAVGFYCARYGKRSAHTEEQRHLGLCVSAGILGLILTYATFDAWGFAKAGASLFLLLGLAGATMRLCREEAEAPGRTT